MTVEGLLELLEKAYPDKWPYQAYARIVIFGDGSGSILQDVESAEDKEMFGFSEVEALVKHLVDKVKETS